MKLLSWNVNGLRAVLKKGFLEILHTENPDILAIQETKLQEDQIPPEINEINGYYKYWNFAEKKGYSGVAIFTNTEPEKVEYSIGDPAYDTEGRLIIAHFTDFVLINCYFPNGQMSEERLQYKLAYYDRMFDLVESMRAEGKNVIVCGDFNTAHKEIDLANPKQNEETSGFLPIERAWMDKIIEHGWIDTFRRFNQESDQYSWWTYRFGARDRNVGWRIDYFFTNNENLKNIKNAFIRQDIMGSDHCPVGVEIE
ncbi:MAG TPA: exodeoxyribonuclease III [Candidatus Cloacimonadota bacterium]|nr:exodeoxyribonuclease III [Candidatus Cloacimonadota bacterium]